MSEHTPAVTLEPKQTIEVPARGRWYFLTRALRPPALRVVAQGERHASWMELFFDLAFVVAVAALGQMLHHNMTVTGFVAFAGLFVLVVWSWLGLSYYADQFDSDDLRFRLIICIAMLGIIVLSINVEAAAQGRLTGFMLAYVLLRLLLLSLYAWARGAVPEARGLCTYYVTGIGVSALLWLFSLLVPAPARYGIWALALLVELATPIAAHMIPTVTVWQSSHMPERFGQFTILVLGEAVLAVTNGAANVVWGWNSVLTAIAGFLVAVSICWLYFGYSDETMVDRSLDGSRGAMMRGFVYGYSHLLIFASIIAISVGIGLAIDETHDPSLHTATRVALFGGMITLMAGMTVNHWTMPYGVVRNVLLFRLGLIAFWVALALGGRTLPSAVLVGALAISLIGLIFFELFSYQEEREAPPLHPVR